MCVGFGAFSLIYALFVKALLPVKWFDSLHMKEEPMTDEEESQAFTTQFRKSFRQSHRTQIEAIQKIASGIN